MGFRSDNKCFKDFINTATRWENGKIGKFTYDTIIPNIPFECRFEEMDSEMKTYIIKSSIERANSEILGRGFIISLLVMRLWPEVDRATTLFKYYYQKSISANANLTDKQFNNQFLQKENEYYLYTKKKLFPFFDDEACEKITDYTREFFEYAREQGCVGEFVEDINEDIVNNVVKDEMDIKLEKVNNILDLLSKEWKLKAKLESFKPYSKPKVNYIKSCIEEFVKNNVIENNGMTVDAGNDSADYRNYAMECCFKILYKTEEKQRENYAKWCELICAIFGIKPKTWNQCRRKQPADDEFIEAVDSILYNK